MAQAKCGTWAIWAGVIGVFFAVSGCSSGFTRSEQSREAQTVEAGSGGGLDADAGLAAPPADETDSKDESHADSGTGKGLEADAAAPALDPDGGAAADPDAAVTSRCTVTDAEVDCSHQERQVLGRLVYFQTPTFEAPAGGFPAVVVYQGSFYGPETTWKVAASAPFGGYEQGRLQAMLLDHGFIVIAPKAGHNGGYWDTNFPAYESSEDAKLIPALLDAIAAQEFGPVDTQRLYATGISSGGYMTSRMAVTYPGEFRALAIESGSYATCSNNACVIPSPLPADHPPTLFLHGQGDVAVPIATMYAYRDQLDKQGIETQTVVDPNAMHRWLTVAPEEITTFFEAHP